MRRAPAAFVVGLLLAAGAAAQSRDERAGTVGMRARIEELVLPGSELAVAPATNETPIVLRIVAVRPHGDRFRYDLEWNALEAGTFDLRDYLIRKDGSALDDLPAIQVKVTALLPKSVREPGDPEPVAPPRVGGYGIEQAVAAVLWIVGLLLILLFGRKRRRAAAAPPAKPTLADRLRPIVEAAASGRADDAQKAELERLLVAFWRERLGLQQHKADRALAAIRAHAEAGELLRQLEAWLHMPAPPQAVDVQALLAPYRGVAVETVEAVGTVEPGVAARDGGGV